MPDRESNGGARDSSDKIRDAKRLLMQAGLNYWAIEKQEINRLREKATALRAEVEKTEQELRARLRQAAEESEDLPDLRCRILADVYWNLLEIKVSWIEEAFEMRAHYIRESAGPAPDAMSSCENCAGELPIQSRTQLASLLLENPRYNRRLCQRCRDAMAREQEMEMFRREKERIDRLNDLRTMPYKLYLQTPEWRERRSQQLRSVGYRCQACNRGDCTLEVHHRTYERRGNERFKDLLVLCDECHQTFHDKGRLPNSECDRHCPEYQSLKPNRL